MKKKLLSLLFVAASLFITSCDVSNSGEDSNGSNNPDSPKVEPTVTISGRVVEFSSNSDGQVIQGATVSIRNSTDPSGTTLTDAMGYFTLTVKSKGNVSLRIEKNGYYISYTFEIDTSNNWDFKDIFLVQGTSQPINPDNPSYTTEVSGRVILSTGDGAVPYVPIVMLYNGRTTTVYSDSAGNYWSTIIHGGAMGFKVAATTIEVNGVMRDFMYEHTIFPRESTHEHFIALQPVTLQ